MPKHAFFYQDHMYAKTEVLKSRCFWNIGVQIKYLSNLNCLLKKKISLSASHITQRINGKLNFDQSPTADTSHETFQARKQNRKIQWTTRQKICFSIFEAGQLFGRVFRLILLFFFFPPQLLNVFLRHLCPVMLDLTCNRVWIDYWHYLGCFIALEKDRYALLLRKAIRT